MKTLAKAVLWVLMALLLSRVEAQPQAIPVPVRDPGFENGSTGWNMPGNGAVVADAASAGQHSARLVVTDPKTDSPYITQQVPIVGGATYTASCMVRTAGVVDRPGRMSTVGAGLIVEWADKQGKWFASGAYATGLYGNHDWTPRRIAELRAPEQAGYAIIYLALRAAGTAWFDDVQLSRVPRLLHPLDPADALSLHSNRPLLQWKDDPQAADYVVELSTDPAFPEGKTTHWQTDRAAFRVPAALSPGHYYWRVSAPGYDPTTRSFEQTAPATQDTTPPDIATDPVRVTRTDAPAVFGVHNDGALPPTVQAALGGNPLRVAVHGGPDEYTASISGQWQPGLNRVSITATDAAGNREAMPVLVLFRPVPAHPVVISKAGFYTDAGHSIFPRGIYQVSIADMPRVKAAGFEIVHNYEFESSRDNVKAKQYLDAATAAGLRVFIGFDRGASGNGMKQGNFDSVIDRVAALCGNPGLFCWYLFDEPEVADQYISPRGLIHYADLIRRLDPYHAVVVTTWGPRMALYRKSFDTHWTQAYTTPAGVVAQLAEHRKLLGPTCPITLLVHSYDKVQTELLRQGKPIDITKFQPDGAWLRAAAFAGITQNVNGLFWWWYGSGDKEFVSISEAPQAWRALADLQSQLKQLEPVLVAPAAPVTGEIKVTGGVLYWWRKTVGNETTIFAVNTSEQEAQSRVPATGNGPAKVLFEGRTVQRNAGAISDSFSRYAVHVYRYHN